MKEVATSLAWTSIAFVMAAVLLIIVAGLGYFEGTGVPWMPMDQLMSGLMLLALISVVLSLAAWLMMRKQQPKPMIVRTAGTIAWIVGICLALFNGLLFYIFSQCPERYC